MKKKSAKFYTEILDKASKDYYLNQPSMSDEDFDNLLEEFKKIYPNHDYFKKVGSKIIESNFIKTKHQIPMGSLMKINQKEELDQWFLKYAKKNPILWSEKIDGLSISLKFVDGSFTQAITRGDGEVGEDVTQNVNKMKFVKKLKQKFSGHIRGEIFLKKSDFENHLNHFANPRNASAGIVRRLDGEQSEFLSIYCYWIEGNFENESDRFKKIEELGLKTPNWGLCKNEDQIQSVWKDYEDKKRNDLDYEIDGICLYINDVSIQDELGIIDNRPRFARAYKFSPQSAVSKLLGINWQAGRTGRITPVAQIEPVNVAGAVISNVSLHNLAEINRLGIKKGSIIHVSRAGDVIPKITKALEGKGGLDIPHNCPACNHEVVREDIFLICPNVLCSAKRIESLLFWIKTLDVKGFGDKMIAKLYEKKLVLEIKDFYKLTDKDIADLDRSGEKIAQKLIKALHDKKEIEAPIFLKALGIEDFGESVAKLILDKYPFSKIFNLNTKDLTEIHGIGPETAQKVVSGLKERKKEIDNLLKVIKILEKSEGVLSGKSYCFSEFRDKNLEMKIKSNGGTISDSVNKGLTALIVKNKNGTSSKIEKAKKYGIEVWNLEEALEKDLRGL